MTSEPKPKPLPGQLDVEEVIELSEKEDGPRGPTDDCDFGMCEPDCNHDPEPLTPKQVVARKLKGELPK